MPLGLATTGIADKKRELPGGTTKHSGGFARKLQGHTEIVLRLRDGRTRVRSRRGGSRGSGVALRYPAPIKPVYVLRFRQSIRINVHVGTGDYGAVGW